MFFFQSSRYYKDEKNLDTFVDDFKQLGFSAEVINF